MYDKKQNNFKSPDLAKLQEVVIDFRTSLYIAVGADAEEARSRYKTRLGAMNKSVFAARKPAAS